MDRFGRVTIPKWVRQQLGIAPGARLILETDADALRLVPVRQEAPMRVENGLIVFDVRLEPNALEQVREERDRSTAGQES